MVDTTAVLDYGSLIYITLQRAKNAREVEAKGAELEAELVKQGITVVDVDMAAFKKAADAAYEKLGFTALRAQIYKEIGKN